MPFDVLVILQDLDLDCLLSDLVLDALLFELLEDSPHSLLEAGGHVEQVDLPPDLLNQGQLLLQPGNALHFYLHLIDRAVIDPNNAVLLQRIEYFAEQLGGDLVLPAEGVDPDHLLLVLFGVLLADGIAIQELVLDIIRIKAFLALLLPPHRLLHHLHHYLLQVVVSDQVGSYAVSVVVVVVLLEQQQFLLRGEGRLHEFNDVCEGVIHGHVEVAEPKEVGVLGNGDVAVADALDQLEDLLLLLVPLEPGEHFLCHEAVHFYGGEVVEEVDGGPGLEQQLFVEEVGLLPAVDQDQDALELVLGQVAHHVLEFLLVGGPQDYEVELGSLRTVDLSHVVEGQVLAVVLGHERVVETEHAIGVGLGDDFGDKRSLAVIEMHVADQQQVALELVILLTLEERGRDEQQFELLEFVQLKHSHLVLRFLVGAQEAPSQLGQSADFLHPGYPKGGVFGHDDGSAFDLLMQNLHQSGSRVERQVGQSTKLLALLQPMADIPNLL